MVFGPANDVSWCEAEEMVGARPRTTNIRWWFRSPFEQDVLSLPAISLTFLAETSPSPIFYIDLLRKLRATSNLLEQGVSGQLCESDGGLFRSLVSFQCPVYSMRFHHSENTGVGSSLHMSTTRHVITMNNTYFFTNGSSQYVLGCLAICLY